jgi:hypothetical protein
VSGWPAVLGLSTGVFTAPSRRLFADLMTGWVLTPGRHTLTRVLTLADPHGRRAHDAYHRFVRAGRWSTGRLWQVLATHAVALACPDGVLELLVDDTLAHKSGRQVAGAGVFRDAIRSTVKRVVYAWGLNLVVVCLRVSPPWGGTPIALPLNLRVRTKKEGKKTTELAAEMVGEIAGWLPERSFHLTGDGAYACLLGAQLSRTQVTSRMRRDAALYEPAPPRTGKRGRPATKGPRLGTPPELAAAAPSKAWTTVTVDVRGRHVERLVVVFDVLWYAVRKDALLRLVVVRDPAGKEPDDFFVTSDLSAGGAEVASRYAGRWPIECCFKEAKQHAGVEHPQSWKDNGPARAVMLAFWLHTAVWCCYLTSWNDTPTWRIRPWYTRKTTPSFFDALAALRRTLWNERITALSSGERLPEKIINPLLDALAEAA